MNTNPVIRFWKIPTTFLLLLFLQPNVWANKVQTVATHGVPDKAMEYAQAMAHPEAPGLKAALIDELKSLSPSKHNTSLQLLFANTFQSPAMHAH